MQSRKKLWAWACLAQLEGSERGGMRHYLCPNFHMSSRIHSLGTCTPRPPLNARPRGASSSSGGLRADSCPSTCMSYAPIMRCPNGFYYKSSKVPFATALFFENRRILACSVDDGGHSGGTLGESQLLESGHQAGVLPRSEGHFPWKCACGSFKQGDISSEAGSRNSIFLIRF
jgi:hypothetical protein